MSIEMCLGYVRRMDGDKLSAIGAAIAEPNRAAMLSALGSGRAHTAGELARWVGCSASTASSHLSHLTDAGLVRVEPSGRFRYYRIASEDIADLLERVGEIELPATKTPPRPKPGTSLSMARSCYDHIAGDLGVRLFQSLDHDRSIVPSDSGVDVTNHGRHRLGDVGIDVDLLRSARRPLTKACLDWTERQHHLGGSLGAALMTMMFNERWIRRGSDRRVIHVTRVGADRLTTHFDITWR